MLDATAGGGGAYDDHDGLDCAGDYCVPKPAITNVEANEASAPLLYLFRGIVPDTAGPGRMRGGASLGMALTPHDTPQLHAMLISHGYEVPNSAGIFGGLEGSCNQNGLIKDAGGENLAGNLDDAAAFEASSGFVPMGAKPGFFNFNAGDVFGYTFQGGGGFGDPIEREPERVRQDVEDETVSSGAAELIYGVVVEEAEIDAEATARRRAEIRAERLGGGEPARLKGDGEIAADSIEIGHTLQIDPAGQIRCSCGEPLATVGENWKDGSHTRVVDPSTHGKIRLHAELEIREHVCPGCGGLIESEVARKGQPDLFTIDISARSLPGAGA
jgi:N-methylhydantoinase B